MSAQLCQFEFEDLTTVTYTNGRGLKEPLALVEKGLQLDTLLALSWYVVNTDEQDCEGPLLKLLGRHLFDFLLPKRSRARQQVQEWCTTTSVHIRLSFKPEASRYAQLPWEFLTVPDGDVVRFLSDFDDVQVTLTRHVPAQKRLATCDNGLRVLVDIASPLDQAEITYGALEQKLNELEDQSGHRLEFRVEHDRSLDAIAADIEKWKPDIYHFCGHGERDALWLARLDDTYRDKVESVAKGGAPLGFGRGQDPMGEPFRASIQAVGYLFERWAPKLVILDACNSDWSWLSEMLPGVAHQLVQRVPAVVAMRYPISNGMAEVFATQLYQGILEGRPLHRAVQQARNALVRHAARSGGEVGRAFGTPVLYVDSSEALCAEFVEGTSEISHPSEARQVAPCPRCKGAGLYTQSICGRCGVPFRCTAMRQPSPDAPPEVCGFHFSEQMVKVLRFCPKCGFEYTNIPPWPADGDAGASALTRPRVLPQPSMPSATKDGMARGAAGPRQIMFPTFRDASGSGPAPPEGGAP